MGDNIFFTQSLVTSDEREKLLRQKGCVIWLTGLSGSGKSTIAKALERKLVDSGHLAYILDGDNIRHGLNSDLGFSDSDRTENIRRIGEVAALFADAGVITITAFISPFRKDRGRARNAVKSGRFYEVFVNAPIEVCVRRDPKGLYKKVKEQGIQNFTGIDSGYEAPEKPDIELMTDEELPEQNIERILSFLFLKKVIEPS